MQQPDLVLRTSLFESKNEKQSKKTAATIPKVAVVNGGDESSEDESDSEEEVCLSEQ